METSFELPKLKQANLSERVTICVSQKDKLDMQELKDKKIDVAELLRRTIRQTLDDALSKLSA